MIPTKTRWCMAIIYLLTITTSFAQEYIETAKLRASVMRTNQLLGSKVAISGDYAMVSAHRESFDANEENYIKYTGAVYVYKKVDNEWVFTQKLTQEHRRINDYYGAMVSMEGEYAVVGIIGEDRDDPADPNYSNTEIGAAIIYKLDTDGIWKVHQHIDSGNDGQTAERFGYPVLIKEGVIVVGALRSGLWTNGEYLARMGCVYTFEKEEGTDQWVRKQKIRPSDGVGQDQFGVRVDIQNETLVVGASLHEPEQYDTWVGAAYVFDKDETGTWVETQKIEASNSMNNALFGDSVAISGDYIFVGAPGEQTQIEIDPSNSNEYGAVYVYKKDTEGIWQEEQYLAFDNVDEYSEENFGESISAFGNKLAITSDEKVMNTNVTGGRGGCFIYELNTNTDSWELVHTITPEYQSSRNEFGKHVIIHNNYIIVGDQDDVGDDIGLNLLKTGAAFIFELSDTLSTGDIVDLKEEIAVFPNPIDTDVVFRTKEPLVNSQLIITDLLGRTVYTESQKLITNTHKITTNFAKGTYILTVRSAGKKYTTKFVK